MKKEITPEVLATKTIVRGIHLDLTPALKQAALNKAAKLLSHNDHIVRIRISIEMDKTRGHADQFVTKGHIEIGGPDLVVTVASEDAYKSLDLLVDKLERLLRHRQHERKDKRNHPHSIDLDSDLPKT